jgi:hypothetical protein
MRAIFLGVLLAATASAASAAEDAHARALAAGYKAAFLCSDVFNARVGPSRACRRGPT